LKQRVESRSDVRFESVGPVRRRLGLRPQESLQRAVRGGGVAGGVFRDRESRERLRVTRWILDRGERGDSEGAHRIGIARRREGPAPFFQLLPAVALLTPSDTRGEQPGQTEAGYDGGTAPT